MAVPTTDVKQLAESLKLAQELNEAKTKEVSELNEQFNIEKRINNLLDIRLDKNQKLESEINKAQKLAAAYQDQLAKSIVNKTTLSQVINQKQQLLNVMQKEGIANQQAGIDLTEKLIKLRKELGKQEGNISDITDSAKKELVIAKQKTEELHKQGKLTRLYETALDALPGSTGKLLKLMVEEDGILLSWIAIVEQAFHYFNKLEESAFSMRKSLGLMREDGDKVNVAANTLRNNILSIVSETRNLGVNFEDVQKTITAISNKFNSLVAMDNNLVKVTTLLSTQLGIAGDETTGFLNVMAGISRTTAASNINMIGFTKTLANAAGIPLGKVMHDIANASDSVRLYTDGTAASLAKASVFAYEMGTSLDKIAETSHQLLDFQTSIENEMEASVLIGKNINFQRARELAFHKDIIGATQEILRITKETDFNRMNPFQMEAFAKATGKSVAELQDMLVADKNIQWIRQHGTQEQREQLSNLQKMKRMRQDEANDIGKRAILDLQTQANQERMAILQNKFNQLILQLVDPLVEILDPLLSIATYVLPLILKDILPLIGVFKFISRFGVDIIKIISSVGKMGASIGSAISKLSGIFKIGRVGLKAIPVLGEMIIALEVIGSLFGTVKSAIKDFQTGHFGSGIAKLIFGVPKAIIDVTLGSIYDIFQTVLGWFGVQLPRGIWNGIKSLGDVIASAIGEPFKKAWNWIEDLFVGHSPSKLALGILRGMVSIGGLLLDAITSPFIHSFNFISDLFGGTKIPKPSTLISDIVNGNTPTTTATTKSTKADATNNQIVQKLEELIGLMKAGGIAVNIDGNRASYLLAENTRKRGGLGATT
jgi:hypothetical protein